MEGRAGLSLGFDLNTGSASRLSERHLSGLLAGLTQTDAVEQRCLQGGARCTGTSERLADKDLERKCTLVLGEITRVGRGRGVPDNVERSDSGICKEGKR